MKLKGLKPVTVLARDRAHGDRLRYMAGCHCELCRKANAAYENQRQRARRAGDWNGIVSADKARSHMHWLSCRGVGRNAIVAATDIARVIIGDIVSGKQTRIRARTERLILAVTVDCALDRALVSAKPILRLISELLEEGYTKTQLAQRLNYKGRRLQIGLGEQVTVRNAARIRRLHRDLTS